MSYHPLTGDFKMVLGRLWVALGVIEMALGAMVAKRLFPRAVYVTLTVIGFMNCCTAALGIGVVQIGLGLCVRVLEPVPTTGFRI